MKSQRTTPHRAWHGVRMRRTEASPEPDASPRAVTLPAAWDEWAAAALAALAPGKGPVSLTVAAQAWINPIAAAARDAGLDLPLADRLHRLLLLRRGAPTDAVWHLDAADGPGFVLNLPAFLDSDGQLDLAAFAEAVETAVLTLSFAAPGVRDIDVGMADLSGLLAALGIGYASDTARDIGSGLACILRGRADAASGIVGERLGPMTRKPGLEWPAPPETTPVRGLREAARAARQAAAGTQGMRHRATTGIDRPGLAEALLGVETGGIAPAFSPVGHAGGLTPGGAGLARGQRRHRRGGAGEPACRRQPAARRMARRHMPRCTTRSRRSCTPCRRARCRCAAAAPAGLGAASCRRAAPATRRRPRSAGTSCSCAPANMPTASWARSSSRCTRRARRSAA